MVKRNAKKKPNLKPWCFGSKGQGQADFKNAVTHAALDLFKRDQRGHLGDIAYLNGGGKLYEKFMQVNDNYSLHSGEIKNITANKAAIAQDLAGTERAIIVGPGPGESFDQKEMQILKLLPQLKEVHFVDVNAQFNKQAAKIVRDYARSSGHSIRVHNHEMDFRNAVSALTPRPNTTVFSTGSLVSNVPNAPLDWFPNHAMGEFIGAFAKLAGDGGKVMLGYDSNNSANTLEKAYNEDLAPFIENIMRIIVDHSRGIKGLKASPGFFHYESEWLERAGQVAHKLIAEQGQKFEICFEGKTHSFFLEKGEEFIVMSSLRPSVDRLTKIAENVFMKTENLYVAESGIVDQIFTVKMPKLPQPGQP